MSDGVERCAMVILLEIDPGMTPCDPYVHSYGRSNFALFFMNNSREKFHMDLGVVSLRLSEHSASG